MHQGGEKLIEINKVHNIDCLEGSKNIKYKR